MNNVIDKVTRLCREYDMLPADGLVIACVSGGTDSMCLLHMLNTLSGRFGFRLAAMHYNHNLRGAESDEDEQFVREYCEALGVKLYVGSGDVASEAARLGRGTEETARDMRYDFFFATAKAAGAERIATAHNADDNLETVLLRIVRGTGLLGLGGIPPVRDNIIRPLLTLSRDEIEHYNLENNVPHREDSTNSSDDYSRNKLRHHVIPVLRELNPSVASNTADMTASLRKDEEYLSASADAFIADNLRNDRLSCAAITALPSSIASRVIRKLCGRGMDFEHVFSVLELCRSDDPSAELSLPGITVRREYGDLVLGRSSDRSFPEAELKTDGSTVIEELGLRFTSEKLENVGSIYKSLITFLFKSDNICGKITIRPRKSGDSIRLSENSGKKTLKRLFIDKKIPLSMRSAVPVICDELGPIAIPGIGCDIRMMPSPGDSVLKVTVEEIKKDD